MLPPLFGWGMVEKFLHNKKTATISMPSDIESHSLFHLIHRRSAVPLPLRGEGLINLIFTDRRENHLRGKGLRSFCFFLVILSAAKNLPHHFSSLCVKGDAHTAPIWGHRSLRKSLLEHHASKKKNPGGDHKIAAEAWLGWLESNQHGQSQSLLSYH